MFLVLVRSPVVRSAIFLIWYVNFKHTVELAYTERKMIVNFARNIKTEFIKTYKNHAYLPYYTYFIYFLLLYNTKEICQFALTCIFVSFLCYYSSEMSHGLKNIVICSNNFEKNAVMIYFQDLWLIANFRLISERSKIFSMKRLADLGRWKWIKLSWIRKTSLVMTGVYT